MSLHQHSNRSTGSAISKVSLYNLEMHLQAELPWEADKQPLAWEDRTPAAFGADTEDSDASDAELIQQAAPSTSGRRPVWDDADDLSAQVNIAAQPRLRKLRKTERDGIVSGVHCFLTVLWYSVQKCPAHCIRKTVTY